MKNRESTIPDVQKINIQRSLFVAAVFCFLQIPVQYAFTAPNGYCADFFRSHDVSSPSPSQSGLRGMREIDLIPFAQAMRESDSGKLLDWLSATSRAYSKDVNRPESVKQSLRDLHEEFKKLQSEGIPSSEVASAFAKTVMNEVFRFHEGRLKPAMSQAVLDHVRLHFFMLVTIAEEAMIVSYLKNPNIKPFEIIKDHLTSEELSRAGMVGGIPVLPGDISVQGSNAMSSAFIMYSQYLSGIGSHNAMISRIRDNRRPAVIEALIEKGLIEQPARYEDTQRTFFLSPRRREARKKIGSAVVNFISENGVPFDSGDGSRPPSPFPYDPTMRWQEADGQTEQGLGAPARFACTTAIEKIYEYAGFAEAERPFSRIGGSRIEGVSAELYDLMGVSGNTNAEGTRTVPSPTEPMLAPGFVLRAYRANYESLISGRRLRLAIDSIFEILEHEPGLKRDFFEGLKKIPNRSTEKSEIMALLIELEKAAAKVKTIEARRVKALRIQLDESLPQTANLRQIAIFASMNAILQPRITEELRKIESDKGGYMSLPELDVEVDKIVLESLQKAIDILRHLPDGVEKAL